MSLDHVKKWFGSKGVEYPGGITIRAGVTDNDQLVVHGHQPSRDLHSLLAADLADVNTRLLSFLVSASATIVDDILETHAQEVRPCLAQ